MNRTSDARGLYKVSAAAPNPMPVTASRGVSAVNSSASAPGPGTDGFGVRETLPQHEGLRRF